MLVSFVNFRFRLDDFLKGKCCTSDVYVCVYIYKSIAFIFFDGGETAFTQPSSEANSVSSHRGGKLSGEIPMTQ